MSIFNPNVKTGADPSYLGFSREREGNKSLATAVKGFGSLAIEGIVAADEALTERAKEATQAGIADIQNSIIGGTPAPDTAAVAAVDPIDAFVDETTAPGDGGDDETSVFGGETLSQQGNPEITQGGKEAERLTSAYKAGKISPTMYWGRMMTLSKRLKAQYPGYSDQIDRTFQGSVGQVPANALATAKRKEVTSLASSQNKEEKKFQTFVQQALLKGYLPPDYYKKIEAGQPYSQMEVYEYVRGKAATEFSVNQQKDRLAIATTTGNLVEEDAIGVAQNDLNQVVTSFITDTFNADVVSKIEEAAKKGTAVTPAEKDQLRQAFGILKAKAEQTIEGRMRKPTANGHTYYSMLKDPGKAKQIKEQALAPLESLEKLLEDDNFGLLAAQVNSTKALKEQANLVVLSQPYFATVNAIKENGGGDIIMQQTLTNPAFQKIQDKAVKNVVQMMSSEQAAGIVKPLVNKLAEVKANPRATAGDKSLASRTLIQNTITALTNKKTTQVAQETAAQDAFGDGNANFLSHFSYNQRVEVYGALVNPTVTKSMLEIKARRPELWNNYKNWAESSFIALQKANVASVQEGFSERQNVKVEWDATTNQFKASVTEAGLRDQENRKKNRDSLLSGVERSLSTDVHNAVVDLNRGIKSLELILKEDGGDVSGRVLQLLQSAGLDTKKPHEQTFFSKAREAIDNALNPPTEEGNNTPMSP